MTEPFAAPESISLDGLLQLPLEDRWARVFAAGKDDLAATLERTGEQSQAISAVSAERLAWAIAFNIEGPPVIEATIDRRRGARGYRDFWPPETPWSLIWAVLTKPFGIADSGTLLGEIALSVACEQRDDWQYPPARPILAAAANRAFDFVYAANKEKVAGTVAKQFSTRAGDPAAIADEAWARVFCDYWSAQARRRFLGISRISTLVCQVARIVAVDILRERKHAISTDDDAGQGGAGTRAMALKELGIFIDPAEKMASTELQQQIGRCVADLPERQRIVVEAVWFREMRAKRAAEIFRVSEAAISQHLKKARIRIRNCLRTHGSDVPG